MDNDSRRRGGGLILNLSLSELAESCPNDFTGNLDDRILRFGHMKPIARRIRQGGVACVTQDGHGRL